jgi:hypothetical protein
MRNFFIFFVLSIVLSLQSCSNIDSEDEFDNRILGHWSVKITNNTVRAMRYEIDSETSGRIVYFSPKGQEGELMEGVPFNDTIPLKRIVFTKWGEFRLVSEDGAKYNHHIDQLTYDSVVFISADGKSTMYRVK